MKKQRYTLIAAWLLLFCFIAGQVIVYSHQHHYLKFASTSKEDVAHHHQQQLIEKCRLCDTMHHTDMLPSQQQYAFDVPAVQFTYPHITFNFKSFGLILADGLSPPAFIISQRA